MKRFSVFIIFMVSILYQSVYAETIFVDGKLALNCSNGTYDIGLRTCGQGIDGRAYKSVGEGILAIESGDTLMIREGYYEAIGIIISFSGNETAIIAYNHENVLIHNPYEPKTNSDGRPTFKLDNRASNILFKDLRLTGTKSHTVDEDYGAIAIGQASGTSDNLITIDNCEFTTFAHCAIKGAFKWHIKNSVFNDVGGTKGSLDDSQDHHIYSTGQNSIGNEAIIEYNYFGSSSGAAIHLYKNPSHHIIRYNIINGNRSSGEGSFWGVLLAGHHHKIYGNTIYDCYNGITLYKANCSNNEIKNNLFDSNSNFDLVIDFGGDSYPSANIVSHNFYGSNRPCGNCKDMDSNGGDDYSPYGQSPNIINSDYQFLSPSPSKWSDFKIAESAVVIDSGENLGPSHSGGLNPLYNSWPAVTSEPNQFGDGWEVGAFIAIGPIGPLSSPRNLRIIF